MSSSYKVYELHPAHNSFMTFSAYRTWLQKETIDIFSQFLPPSRYICNIQKSPCLIFLFFPPAGTSGAYATGQPRRSCLKPSQYTALQRSHSVHSYSYSSLQCVHHHPNVDQCCTNSFYSNPQLNASHAAVCGKAKEFPVYYSKPRTNIPNCTRHNSISGYIGYKSPLHPDDYSPVPPDLCKMASSGTKRVGWKEVLHEGSEFTMMPSRGSTDTSTSSTTSTITLGPKHPSSCSRQNSIKSNNAVKIGNVDNKIHAIDDQWKCI